MRVGIAHHFGWAVAVTASADYQVVDRRRIELIEPGMAAPPATVYEVRRHRDLGVGEGTNLLGGSGVDYGAPTEYPSAKMTSCASVRTCPPV
jgi:hypothetical protein